MALTDRDKRTLRTGGIILGVLLVAFVLFKVLPAAAARRRSRRRHRCGRALPPRRRSADRDAQPDALARVGPAAARPVLDPAWVPGEPDRPDLAGKHHRAGRPSWVEPRRATTSSGSTPGTTSSTTRTPTADTATTTIGGHTITLLDTSSSGVEQASVEVDATVYHPSAGQSFGPNRQYMLQSVSGTCATFLFGDEAFTLCVPQNK